MEVPASRIYSTQDEDINRHSVISFLEREQLLATTSGSGYEYDSKLYDIMIPEKLFNDMVVQKLKGFSSFKATAVIRLQVQSQPFMAGRIMMAALPVPTLLGERGDYAVTSCDKMMLMNHVQLDLSHETEVVLRIPFVSPYNCYDLIASRWSWARVVVRWYGPYNVIGSQAIDTMLYGHFENIEMGHPTTGQFAEFKAKTLDIPELQMNCESHPTGDDFSRAQTQERSSLSGVVEKLLPGAGGLVGTLGNLLGFSKPQNLKPTMNVYNRPATNFGNVDGLDTSHVLAYSTKNASAPLADVTGTGVDEMSFNYLKKIPQYYDYFEYDDKSKGMLKSWPVTPCGNTLTPLRHFRNNKTFTFPQPLHLSYISSICKYWSGSLVYTFKIIKTNYHSGRLLFAFSPFSDAPKSIQDTDYAYRAIVDIREKSEVSFTVPFISQSPMKRISPEMDLTMKYSDHAYSCTGTVSIWALTSLKSQSTIVSSKIRVLCEISAGDDYYTSAPVESGMYPFTLGTDYTAQVDYRLYGRKYDPYNDYQPTSKDAEDVPELQGLFSSPGTESKRSQAIEGQPESITQNMKAARNLSKDINGELFLNFREFIKRNNFITSFQLKEEYREWQKGNNFHINKPPFFELSLLGCELLLSRLIRPPTIHHQFVVYKRYGENTVEDSAYQILLHRQNCPLSFVSAMYAFYHGGIRAKFAANSNSIIRASYLGKRYNDEYMTGQPSTGWNGGIHFANSTTSYAEPIAYEQLNNKAIAEFSVPYYGSSLMASHWLDSETFYSSKPDNCISVEVAPLDNVALAVSAADDLDFKCFIGTPPVLSRTLLTGSRLLDSDATYHCSNIYVTENFLKRDPFMTSRHTAPLYDPWYGHDFKPQTVSPVDLTTFGLRREVGN